MSSWISHNVAFVVFFCVVEQEVQWCVSCQSYFSVAVQRLITQETISYRIFTVHPMFRKKGLLLFAKRIFLFFSINL